MADFKSRDERLKPWVSLLHYFWTFVCTATLLLFLIPSSRAYIKYVRTSASTYVRSLIYSFTHSLTQSAVRWSPIHPSIHPSIHPCMHSLIHSVTHVYTATPATYVQTNTRRDGRTIILQLTYFLRFVPLFRTSRTASTGLKWQAPQAQGAALRCACQRHQTHQGLRHQSHLPRTREL